MDCKVIWTDPAIEDLKEIVAYIAHDDREAARRVGFDIIRTVELLDRFPMLGVAYPRGVDGRVREIVCWGYRVFHRLCMERKLAEILTVWRGARREPRLWSRTSASSEPSLPLGSLMRGVGQRHSMTATLVRSLAFTASFTFWHCTACPRDAGAEPNSGPRPPAPDGERGTIKARAFGELRSISAADHGLTAGSPADQSSALAKAMQSASDRADIDAVLIPEGTFYFTKPIWLKEGVSLIGAGTGKTVLESKDESDYLLRGKGMNCSDAIVANLTLRNHDRILLMQGARQLAFRRVEFSGGIVRLEKCSEITFEGNVFIHTRGKSAYSSSDCSRVRIVDNKFISSVDGSLNLSGHKDCHVAWNHIFSSNSIVSGYAGIRLPNGAMNNVIEENVIENHGRGIFVLSSSENNIVKSNVVRNTTAQGVLIQSSGNVIEGNTIIDASLQAIYVVDAGAKSSPTPSIAAGNKILNNLIYDTRRHEDPLSIGLQVSSQSNIVRGNRVSKKHGRPFKAIKGAAGNQDSNNLYELEVETFDFNEWTRTKGGEVGNRVERDAESDVQSGRRD